MVVFTVYVIHGARCSECKKWIPKTISREPDFPSPVKCTKCGKEYTAKQLVNDLKGKLDVKEFNSEKLFKRIVLEYLARNSSKEDANIMAQRVVEREQVRFQEKYGFLPKQNTLTVI